MFFMGVSLSKTLNSKPQPCTDEIQEIHEYLSCCCDKTEIMLKGTYNTIQSIGQFSFSFNFFLNKTLFSCVCSTSLLKTLLVKEKLLVKGDFSFSHCVFYSFGEFSAIFINFIIVVCKLFQFERV